MEEGKPSHPHPRSPFLIGESAQLPTICPFPVPITFEVTLTFPVQVEEK